MTDNYKKIVLAGGCLWVRNGMGPILQDPASSFANEVIQKSDRVYRSRREKEDNLICYV
jgi:hypothetical protein